MARLRGVALFRAFERRATRRRRTARSASRGIAHERREAVARGALVAGLAEQLGLLPERVGAADVVREGARRSGRTRRRLSSGRRACRGRAPRCATRRRESAGARRCRASVDDSSTESIFSRSSTASRDAAELLVELARATERVVEVLARGTAMRGDARRTRRAPRRACRASRATRRSRTRRAARSRSARRRARARAARSSPRPRRLRRARCAGARRSAGYATPSFGMRADDLRRARPSRSGRSSRGRSARAATARSRRVLAASPFAIASKRCGAARDVARAHELERGEERRVVALARDAWIARRGVELPRGLVRAGPRVSARSAAAKCVA